MVEGRLTIDLRREGGDGARIRIGSSRPMSVADVFNGKEPAMVSRTLPLLFSVCSMAQGHAANRALTRAAGGAVHTATEAARECLVLMETAREHLLAIAMRWPGLLGETTDNSRLRAVNGLLVELRSGFFADTDPFDIETRANADVMGLNYGIDRLDKLIIDLATGFSAEAFLALETPEDLRAWAATTNTVAARLAHRLMVDDWSGAGDEDGSFLPELADDELADRLLGGHGETFVAQPDWNGTPQETTSLSRRREETLVAALLERNGKGLLTRLAARLVDLARVPGELRARATMICNQGTERTAETPANGIGLAQVEAARGRLVHGVVVESGQVAEYRILAPTEWNFHPLGAAVQGLANLAPDNDLEDKARLLVDLIDPCVAYDLRIA